MYVRKSNLRCLICIAVCSISVPVRLQADANEVLRKTLGIIGACLVVRGIVKVISHPIKGFVSGVVGIMAGAVVGLGGICSDIILSRIQYCKWQKRPNQGVWQQAYHVGRQIWTETADTYENSQSLSRDGHNDLSCGRFCTGAVKIYNGVYHGIRARCLEELMRYDA